MPAKLSHEQVVSRIHSAFPHFTVTCRYVRANIKIDLLCGLCGHEWCAVLSSLMSGHGCPECARLSRLDEQGFLSKLSEQKPSLTMIGKYQGLGIKTLFRCSIDGYEWQSRPETILRGGCPKCAGNARITAADLIVAVEQHGNSNIQILSNLTDVKTHQRVKAKCSVDGYDWEPTVHALMRGVGCPMCYGNVRKTHEEFISEMAAVNDTLEILGIYKQNKTGIAVRCKIHDYVWSPTPNYLLRGGGCPICCKRGFDVSKPAILYTVRFGVYYGFGITNDFTDRMTRHYKVFEKENVTLEVVKTYSGSGSDIQMIESSLKRSLPIVNTGVDGFRTEAVYEYDAILLFREIDKYIQKNLCLPTTSLTAPVAISHPPCG